MHETRARSAPAPLAFAPNNVNGILHRYIVIYVHILKIILLARFSLDIVLGFFSNIFRFTKIDVEKINPTFRKDYKILAFRPRLRPGLSHYRVSLQSA